MKKFLVAAAVFLLAAASPAFAQARKLSDAACRLDGGAGCGGSGGGSGTVTSVAISGGTTGFSFSGSPITTSGTFTLSGTLAIANGGTNLTTYTLGDVLYASAANTLAKLAGNTTTTKKFLMQVGDGMNSAAPTWTATAADFPTFNQSTTGNAATATALASNPTDCSAGQYANAIAASGNLTCGAVAYSEVTGTPSLATVATSGSASDLGTGTLPIARIADGAVTLAKLADLAQDQFIGRTTASTGVPQTATITAAARTVLDDTSVGAMVDTLGGASASGTGGLARATDPGLVRPAVSGTPAAAGALGYDSANGQTTQYSGLTASVGSFPRVLAVGRPGNTLTNSTTSDQDFPSVYTIPASVLVANKIIRVTVNMKLVSGTSTATLTSYMKLGSTKLFSAGVATNVTDGSTRTQLITFHIMGTAAAGASVAVEAGVGSVGIGAGYSFVNLNSVDQPVSGLATNGTLAITLGNAWSATGSTETMTLLSYLVEELN